MDITILFGGLTRVRLSANGECAFISVHPSQRTRMNITILILCIPICGHIYEKHIIPLLGHMCVSASEPLIIDIVVLCTPNLGQ